MNNSLVDVCSIIRWDTTRSHASTDTVHDVLLGDFIIDHIESIVDCSFNIVMPTIDCILPEVMNTTRLSYGYFEYLVMSDAWW
jgi:hypothetical protein